MLYPTELRPRASVWCMVTHAPPVAPTDGESPHFIVGITNCAPSRAVVGQREVTVFRRV